MLFQKRRRAKEDVKKRVGKELKTSGALNIMFIVMSANLGAEKTDVWESDNTNGNEWNGRVRYEACCETWASCSVSEVLTD